MRKMVRVLCAAVCLGLLFAVCSVGAAQFTGAGAQTTVQISQQVSVVQQTEKGMVDYTNGIVRATGMGAPPAGSQSIAQRKAMARRAAIVDAQRNISELINGVYVEGETLMRDFVLVNDDVRSATQGYIYGLMPDESSLNFSAPEADGSFTCTIDVVANLAPFFGVIYNKNRALFVTQPVAPTTTVSVSVYTGLIINLRGLSWRYPAMFRVVTVGGRLIYGPQAASLDYACASRLATYINSVIAAKQNLQDRVGANPLVIEAASIGPNGDIVVPETYFTQVTTMTTVLQQCRVVVTQM